MIPSMTYFSLLDYSKFALANVGQCTHFQNSDNVSVDFQS